MRHAEPYNPNKLEHQEPVIPLSEWQDYNDADGSESIAWERDLAEDETTVHPQPVV